MGAMQRLLRLDAEDRAFAPDLIRVQESAPAPLSRLVIWSVVVLVAVLLAWAAIGRVDIIAVAPGKLVPQGFLQIVQPFEAGIVKDLLVREGDRVEAGQVLVRMDSIVSNADHRSLSQELQLRSLQLRRIDAELAEGALRRLPADPMEVFAQVDALLRQNRQAYLDGVAEQQAQLSKARQDRAAAQEAKATLEKSLPVIVAQDEGWQKLANEGFAGKLLAMERKRARIEREGEIAAQVHQVAALDATIKQAEQRIAQLRSSYRSRLQAERVEALGAHQKLEQELAKQSHRKDLLELKAPEAGVIKDLATHTPGSVIQPGTVLMTLVPADDALIAEVWVSNDDAGFVTSPQSVKIKLAAYPFQKYGMLEGAVSQVSPDASEPARGNTLEEAHGAQQPLSYRTLVRLKSSSFSADGKQHRLTSGMQVIAEIHLGTRTVLEYLLSPVSRVVAEAGRER